MIIIIIIIIYQKFCSIVGKTQINWFNLTLEKCYIFVRQLLYLFLFTQHEINMWIAGWSTHRNSNNYVSMTWIESMLFHIKTCNWITTLRAVLLSNNTSEMCCTRILYSCTYIQVRQHCILCNIKAWVENCYCSLIISKKMKIFVLGSHC